MQTKFWKNSDRFYSKSGRLYIITEYAQSVIERNENHILFHEVIGRALVAAATLEVSSMDANDHR